MGACAPPRTSIVVSSKTRLICVMSLRFSMTGGAGPSSSVPASFFAAALVALAAVREPPIRAIREM